MTQRPVETAAEAHYRPGPAPSGPHRLLFPEPDGSLRPTSLAEHTARHGPLTIGARPTSPAELAEWIEHAGLQGRGGAGFPTSSKWASLHRNARAPHLVVNAMEGEPASFKDQLLLSHAPHLVLDGADITAWAIGADAVTLCIPDTLPTLAAGLHAALAARASRYSSDRHPGPTPRIRPLPHRYLTGEESALITALGRAPSSPDSPPATGRPAWRPDKSIPLRLGRQPVLVHNAETVAQVALIARHGPEWFRSCGTASAPGTTLVSISGAVDHPGVLEVALGTPVRTILDAAGAPSELAAVLSGGYGGAWLHPARLDTPYAPGDLAAAGATLGVGILIALPTTGCPITELARIAQYMASQSAGQCGPCTFGLPAIAEDLVHLAAGHSDPGVIERITTRCAQVTGRGACGLPDGAVRVVRGGLDLFALDAAAHARGRPCGRVHQPSVLTFPDTHPLPGTHHAARTTL